LGSEREGLEGAKADTDAHAVAAVVGLALSVIATGLTNESIGGDAEADPRGIAERALCALREARGATSADVTSRAAEPGGLAGQRREAAVARVAGGPEVTAVDARWR
jgi:hypothetical protein